MQDRSAKKIYSQSALEFWFKTLPHNWESIFTDSELKKGRHLYREGEILELELSQSEAIINSKIGGEPLYSVVEWDKEKLVVRSSTNDALSGRELAAAGLYELEELIADEVSATTPIFKAKKKEEKPQEPPKIVGNATYSSLIELSCDSEGLVLIIAWKDKEGSIKRYTKAKLLEQLGPREREELIHITSVAHKAQFKYSKKLNAFTLRNPMRISRFFVEDIHTWREKFDIQMDEEAKLFTTGIEDVEIKLDVNQGSSDQKIKLNWEFQTSHGRVSYKDAQRVLGFNNNIAFVKKVGLVRMQDEQGELINKWKVDRKKYQFSNDEYPKYMLFSLMEIENATLDLSDELNDWRRTFGTKDPHEIETPPFLRQYQHRGVRWLSHMLDCDCHPLIADEMGLGKTIQILSLITSRPNLKIQDSIIVCPASVIPVWQKEIDQFFPFIQTEVLSSHNPFNGNESKSRIWLSSYSQIRRHKNLLESKKFQYSVLDEAQFIKNPDSKATIACMSIRSDYRIALTGTPVENHHFDIWTIFRYLMPGLLGNRFEFKKNYLEKPKEGIVRLQKQLTPFIIRRTKKEVTPELPDKMEFNLICPLTEKQRKEYIQIGNNCIQTYGEDLDELNSSNTMDLFTILTRLRQTACDPDLLPWTDAELNQSGKLSVLADKMEETIANNHKVVIFSQFVGLLKRVRTCLEKRFPELVINELTGNTKDRSEPVQKFQRAKKPTVILVSLKAGGTGITLHNADYLFLMDPWWNPAVEEQAIDRVHRIGQKKTVMVFRMISEGTIEEKIQELKSHKKELFNKLVGKIPDVSILKNHVQSIKELITLK